MSETLEREIAALPEMNLTQLRAKWRQRLKEPPPLRVRRSFRSNTAYKLQDQAHGGLKPETGFNLKGSLAATGATRLKGRRIPRAAAHQPRNAHAPRVERRTKSRVVESGFEYEGERHTSLSVIARKITGTRWSGPLFFGLKDRPLMT